MDTVTISPKYQIVIPRSVRDSLQLESGEKVQIFQYENRIEVIPQRSLQRMRGFLKGIDTTVERDADRV